MLKGCKYQKIQLATNMWSSNNRKWLCREETMKHWKEEHNKFWQNYTICVTDHISRLYQAYKTKIEWFPNKLQRICKTVDYL